MWNFYLKTHLAVMNRILYLASMSLGLLVSSGGSAITLTLILNYLRHCISKCYRNDAWIRWSVMQPHTDNFYYQHGKQHWPQDSHLKDKLRKNEHTFRVENKCKTDKRRPQIPRRRCKMQLLLWLVFPKQDVRSVRCNKCVVPANLEDVDDWKAFVSVTCTVG
jgi:hypothetical protein